MNANGQVSIYVIMAMLLVAYSTVRLHMRKKNNGAYRTRLHPQTSATITILTVAAALCATIHRSLSVCFVYTCRRLIDLSLCVGATMITETVLLAGQSTGNPPTTA